MAVFLHHENNRCALGCRICYVFYQGMSLLRGPICSCEVQYWAKIKLYLEHSYHRVHVIATTEIHSSVINNKVK